MTLGRIGSTVLGVVFMLYSVNAIFFEFRSMKWLYVRNILQFDDIIPSILTIALFIMMFFMGLYLIL